MITGGQRYLVLTAVLTVGSFTQGYEGEVTVVLVSSTGREMRYASACRIFETEDFQVFRFETIKIDMVISKKEGKFMVVDRATNIVWSATKAELDSLREANLKAIQSAISFAAGKEKSDLEKTASRYAMPGKDSAQLSETREGELTTFKVLTGNTIWLSITVGRGDGVFPVYSWLADLGVVPRVKGENRAITGTVEKLSFRFVAGNYLFSLSFSKISVTTEKQEFKMPEKYETAPFEGFQRFHQTEIPEPVKDGKK